MTTTGWLKTTEIYSLIALEVRIPKAKFGQTWFLLGHSREDLFHACLLASVGCSQSSTFLYFQRHHFNL